MKLKGDNMYVKINVDTIKVNTMNVNSLIFLQRLSHITRLIVLYSVYHKPRNN